MSIKEQVSKLLFDSIDQYNSGLPKADQIDKKPKELLFCKGSKLDSMSYINLSTAIENKLSDTFGISESIFNSYTIVKNKNALKTVASTLEYLESFVKENKKS